MRPFGLLHFQEMVELPDYNKITFKENPAIPLEEIVPDTPPQAVNLLNKFLVYPSKQRCSARQVRDMKWTSGLKVEFLRSPGSRSRVSNTRPVDQIWAATLSYPVYESI